VIIRMRAKGLLSIPLEIRRKLRIKVRSRVHVDIDRRGYKIILTPITLKHIHSLQGKYKGKGLLKALIAEKEK